ncbi:hypothetical protein GGS23DRAFT_200221 [Durotheca rogersii]|uniref:uncharacterized protein n=1 Tax=Durotheca rogersii TaxID=419775 RepID=UPI00221ECCAF|nr:uncharacterized protein GGS23DRAFT_200221 [Durotheca rogersii]KAI5867839.1 hypothetical protein GGS23DRAFT_200221 [Durotheca rogersii]
MLSSCFGLCKKKKKQSDPEQEPLLPQYEHDTHLQRELYRKLHSYQMLRALTEGYMPSTEQVIVNLRTLLASDLLNPDNPDLSDSGRRLVRLVKLWLQQFIALLRHKNDKDQLQDLIWLLSKSEISVDVDDLRSRAKKSKTRADIAAAYQSLRTVGSLLLTNPEFRTFLGDLHVVGREILRDSAFALSDAARLAGEELELSSEEGRSVTDDDDGLLEAQNLEDEFADAREVLANRGADVASATFESVEDKLSGDEGQALLKRLHQAVLSLRKRKDYSNSVSTLSLLIKRYAVIYSRSVEQIVEVAQSDIEENQEADRALTNLWEFVKSFGNKREWERCEDQLKRVISHKDTDPEFENLLEEIGNSLQKLLIDPGFFSDADQKIRELRERSKEIGPDSVLRQDVDELLEQLSVTFRSVLRDDDIHNLAATTLRIFRVISPENSAINPDLIQDGLGVFIPLLIAAIQHVPIPRLEISTPAIDLLLENLIIEPGTTVNNSQFLPHRLKIETYNNVEIRKAGFRTSASSKNLMLIKIDGLSARADEVGFWLRAHSRLFRFADEGIASFALDERGIDIHLEVEICRDRLEQVLTLRRVRVRVHKLNFKLRESKLRWVSWFLKPVLRPVLKSAMEAQLATAIAALLHAGNRELLYARERLRATRIADPGDLWTFLKAVAARLVPGNDPDSYTRVGVEPPGKGVFQGVYAPGSLVKTWHEEAVRAAERIEEFEAGGWKNDVFNTPVDDPET